MSGNKLDVPVYTFLLGRPVTGNLGIEIEAEGTKTGQNPEVQWHKNIMETLKITGNASKYWIVKGDNSLRNGAEYVTVGAVPIEELDTAMAEWSMLSKGTRYRHDSIRTSVHYHVNISRLTARQILTAVMGWWLLETPIVDLQGPSRVGNLFCLRVSDAEHLVNAVLKSIDDPCPLMGNSLHDNVKYAALNLNTIRRFGSLEFRFNRGSVDPHEIARWARFFNGLVQSLAAIGDPKTLIEIYEGGGAAAFVQRFTPPWLRQLITSQHGWQEKIASNYSYAYMIHSKLDMVAVKNKAIREVHVPWITLNPEEQDYPLVDPSGKHKGLYDLQEFSPDEDKLPDFSFVKAVSKKKKRAGYMFIEPMQIQAFQQQANPVPDEEWVEPDFDDDDIDLIEEDDDEEV